MASNDSPRRRSLATSRSFCARNSALDGSAGEGIGGITAARTTGVGHVGPPLPGPRRCPFTGSDHHRASDGNASPSLEQIAAGHQLAAMAPLRLSASPLTALVTGISFQVFALRRCELSEVLN